MRNQSAPHSEKKEETEEAKIKRVILAAVAVARVIGTAAAQLRATGETMNTRNHAGTTRNMHAIVTQKGFCEKYNFKCEGALARTPGASGAQIFRTFVLPSALPVIFTGLRLGLVYALLGVVGGEIIASEHGLGQALQLLAVSFKTNGVFAIIILLSLVSVCIMSAMNLLENRLLRWR